MGRYLIYNFSGDLDDLSHLFPNERLAQMAAVIRSEGGEVEIWDRGNADTFSALAPSGCKRAVARWAGKGVFRKLAETGELKHPARLLYGLPLKWMSGSMNRQIEAAYDAFMRAEAERIVEGAYNAVLLNLWQGGFDESMLLARSIKARTRVPIIGIGQRVDWFHDHILRLFPQIDAIILGLGYDAVRGLVSGGRLRDLPDVSYRDPVGSIVCNEREVTDVAGLPHPAYDPSVYHGIEGLIPLYHVSLSNQACPNRCAFCPRPANYGRVVRRKPMAQVLDEVEALRDRGVRCFRVADSTPPPGLLTELADGLVARGLSDRDVHFTAFSRIDQNREEDFSLMKRANVDALFFGLESLDDDNLRRMRKGIRFDEIRDTLEAAHDAGIFVVGSIIYPLPGETERSRDVTFSRLAELSGVLDSILIQPAGVYPTSAWGINPQDFDIHLDPEYVEKLINYPVKFIIPMRFWPPFPFSYALMGRPATEVTFDEIRTEFESFSRRVWGELGILNVQDYTLMVARMLDRDPYEFTDEIKRVLVTRDYDAVAQMVDGCRQYSAADEPPAPPE